LGQVVVHLGNPPTRFLSPLEKGKEKMLEEQKPEPRGGIGGSLEKVGKRSDEGTHGRTRNVDKRKGG